MKEAENLQTAETQALNIPVVSSSVACKHVWKHGYTLEPVVFCKNCNKDADQVYIGMPYNEQIRLVVD